jgi:hypothetical protein
VPNDREDDRTESVRSAWTRCLRKEALRMRDADVSKIVHIGLVLATYANADGTNAWPAVPTLATIAGCAEDVVSRSMAALVGIGLLRRKRRPNETPMHVLVIPLGSEPLVWEPHLEPFVKARAATARRRARSAERNRNPVPTGVPEQRPDGVRNTVPTGVPEHRPDGGSEGPGTLSRRGTEHRPDRVPEHRPVGGVHGQLLPTVGDPLTDTDVLGLVGQPQVGAREAAPQDQFSPGLQALPGGGRGPAGGQAPLLLSVHAGPPTPLDHSLIAAHMTALYSAPVPVRRAATTAVEILGDLDLPDPTAYVLGVLDADPARYRPTLPPALPAPRRRAGGTA